MHEIPTEVFAPRQTNTGLYVQMHNSGFTRDDLLAAQHAYRLSCRLFNGRYRKTERAFICHAVGAASSVASFDNRLSLVLAAMLHAAYDSGQFPDGRIGGPSPAHREWLTAQLGAEVESIVYRYSGFGFELGAPERYLREGYNDADRDLLLIALAHEVDDVTDLGLRFAPKYGESTELRIAACATLADQMGKPELARTLRAHARLYESAGWVNALESPTLHGYCIIPNTMAYLRHRFGHFRRKFVKLH